MRKTIRSYTTFTRRERLGILCLCSILVALLVLRVTMHHFVQGPTGWEADTIAIKEAWATYNRSGVAAPRIQPSQWPRHQDADDGSGVILPDSININTADSATLVRLRGIGPATARKVVQRRTEVGLFTDIEQLREVGSFYDTVFILLRQHLYIGEAADGATL